ncbi:MAG: DNA/RNA nuclease SfsA [Caldilineaceae bacterium]|nr:DNA/RNA nuclease SfsA [Caldilineaceae bacterium]
MHFPFTTQPATFLERPNRYRIVAQLHESNQVIHAHCPDPGRLRELLIPGVTVHLSPASHTLRKTAYDLRFVAHPDHGQLVSLDTRIPNQIFQEGLESGFFDPFRGYQSMQREVPLPQPPPDGGVHSRIDYRLIDAAGQPCWIEVKSATLVEERCARFPDAVTARGRRHVLELAELAQSGVRTAVVFIIQRPDADLLRPQWSSDPAFGYALVAAQAAGVAIYAYTCLLTLEQVTLERHIPVALAVGE